MQWHGPLQWGLQVSIYDVRDGAGAGSLDTSVRVGSFGIGDATGHNLTFVVAKDDQMGKASATL